jgi:hypothetical protein
MLPEGYEYTKSQDGRGYKFFSEGPRGRIPKAVFYHYLESEGGYEYYNLAFGDYNREWNQIIEFARSDNNDQDKILATVIATLIEFTQTFKNCRIVIKGITPARTRLFQVKIVAYYDPLIELFDIQGEIEEGQWAAFKVGQNYLRFLFQRK